MTIPIKVIRACQLIALVVISIGITLAVANWYGQFRMDGTRDRPGLGDWYKQVGPAAIFTIEMPGQPGYRLEKRKSGDGTWFDYYTYLWEKEARTFVIQTASYPSDVDVSNPEANLKSALDASERYLENKVWDNVSWLQIQGSPAVEAVGKLNERFEQRSLFVLRGREIYTLGYTGRLGSSRSADANRFFGSLRIPR